MHLEHQKHTEQPTESNALNRNSTPNPQINQEPKRNRFSKLINLGGDTVKQLWHTHRKEIVGFAFTLAAIILDVVTSQNGNAEDESNSSPDSRAPLAISGDEYHSALASEENYFDSADTLDDFSESTTTKEKRKSPKAHTVEAKGQHYWINGKRVWKEKENYQRGERDSDD